MQNAREPKRFPHVGVILQSGSVDYAQTAAARYYRAAKAKIDTVAKEV